MNTRATNTMKDSSKKLSVKDFAYSGAILLFLLLTLVLFFLATQFITKNINKIFTVNVTDGSEVLNLGQYKLATKKLNIEIPVSTDQINLVATSAPSSIATTTQITKSSLTITIRNSTSNAGVATALAKELSGAGFAKATTGNEPTRYATTTIIFKDRAASFSPAILEVIKKTYSFAVSTTTSKANVPDITIIIGAH